MDIIALQGLTQLRKNSKAACKPLFFVFKIIFVCIGIFKHENTSEKYI
jgi:hypothetical protein